MNLSETATQLNELTKNIVLIYAFNSTGKTRLSVSFKDKTKDTDGKHTGVYYNAFSEDLFVWDNDEAHDGQNMCLNILSSSLNKFHTSVTEDLIKKKLKRYKPKYNFSFEIYSDAEKGIEKVYFFIDNDKDINIKISRGEERIFVWCFFLVLFEVDGWADEQSKHIFIDDPVSSLDDHNIFMTAITLFDLIENNFENKKIILTTHHIGLFSTLHNWLNKGERKEKFKKNFSAYILDSNELKLFNKKSVFLYHLHLLQKLKEAINSQEIYTYHFVLLRQVLENIASFLGSGQFGYVLKQIGIEEPKRADIINILSHKNIFYYEVDIMVPENKELFKDIVDKLFIKYKFKVGE